MTDGTAMLPIVELAKKRCVTCRNILPLLSFGRNERMRLGVRSSCRSCEREKALEWNDKHYDRRFAQRLRSKFGITPEQYERLLAAQEGVCAICRQPPRIPLGRETERTRAQGRQLRPMLVVDHDHLTGDIRGLLCVRCNRGIGFLKDDPALVRSALDYLENRT